MHQRVVRDFAEGPGQFRASGARADDDERHPGAQLFGILFAFGGFEGEQDAAAHRGGVVNIFQPGSELRPFVMAEILVHGAGGHDECVVVE